MKHSMKQTCLLGAVALIALPAAVSLWWMLPGGQSTEPHIPHDVEQATQIMPTETPGKATDARGTAQTAQPSAAVAVEFSMEPGALHAHAEALRSQNIPEPTVREIIASRITAAFEARRLALRNESLRSRNDDAIQYQLESLARQQGALIEEIFGPAQPQAQTFSTLFSAEGEKPPQMPAAMADALPATVRTEEQAAALEKVRADFIEAIGGVDLNPGSPEYRQRWLPAQSDADQRFRLLFGDNAFVQHQLQAAQEARQREATGRR